MTIPADTRSSIARACGTMKSDTLVAHYYGVTAKQVAAIRRTIPTPRPMAQHEPIEDRSVTNDQLRDDAVASQCRGHREALLAYYQREGRRWNLEPIQFAFMVNNAPVTRENAAWCRQQRGLRWDNKVVAEG